jgi:hypothetical protein
MQRLTSFDVYELLRLAFGYLRFVSFFCALKIAAERKRTLEKHPRARNSTLHTHNNPQPPTDPERKATPRPSLSLSRRVTPATITRY